MESTYILAAGLLSNGQTFTIGSVNYDRTLQQLVPKTIDGHLLTQNLPMQLTVADVPTGLQFFIPTGANTALPVDLSAAPIFVPAGSALGLVIQTIGDDSVRDVIVTISSQSSGATLDPNWIVPTATDLKTAMDDQTYSAATSAAIRGKQADPVPALLSARVLEFRRIAARHSALGPAGSIDGGFLRMLIVLVKHDLLSGSQALRTFVDGMKDDWDWANKQLERLIDGKSPVMPPVNPLATQPVPGASYGSEPRIDL